MEILRKVRLLGKQAGELRTELLPQQERVVERIQRQPGLLVAHGLGSGKTLSSIAAATALGGKSRALVPASLIPNYEKEIQKHVKGPSHISVESQQRAALRGESSPTDLLIVDEAHRARELNTNLYKLLREYPAKKRLLLSATPVYNRPSDIAPLVNIAAGEEVLPTGSSFDEKFVYRPPAYPGFFHRVSGKPMHPTLKNKEELQRILGKWVDYAENTGGEFPESTEEQIRVPMSDIQTQLHAAAWKKMPWGLRRKLKAGYLPSRSELSAFNKFESQTRQVSGSSKKYLESDISPKLQAAVESLAQKSQEDPTSKAIVYSNYLNNLQEYSDALGEKNIPHRLFTGNVPRKERDDAVNAYNAGKIKALLLSSAGGEGLDLKGTRLVQVLEPHWNEEKLDQVIGRAIRHKSHAELPEDKRNILIQRYLTHPKPGLWNRFMRKDPMGVEDVLSGMSKNKKDLNEQVRELLRQNN
jgi:SNF2 family DNA or RNA helicase